MKQILNHLRTGQIEVADVPCPVVRPNHLLVQSTRSLISAGTERMLVEFGQAGLIAKARSQPDKVRQVLDKIKTDGLLPTLETVFSRLDEPMPLGYCSVGRVVEVGPGVTGFQVGDRVASSGSHAEMVCVPATLAAKIPDEVDDVSASFTVLGSIALNGVRLLAPTFGEQFVVYGLGLLGILSVQLLRAHGCKVLGVDLNRQRCDLAEQFGAQAVCIRDGGDPGRAAGVFSAGRGVDGVLVTASAKNDTIMTESAQMCRKRGRIVLVGVVNLSLNRADFYERELSFQVACSYGPGRYDPAYESGRDYPRDYVRWTVARNFEALLESMAAGQLELHPLVSRELPLADASQAYESIVKDSSVLGVVIQYPDQPAPTQRVIQIPRKTDGVSASPAKPVVGVIGAGNFAKLVMLPAIKAYGAPLRTIASAQGVTALHAARKFNAEQSVSDYREILDDPAINTVFITTRHNSHAKMVVESLAAGKHVFVEKPVAIDEAGLQSVRDAQTTRPDRMIMCGFNRRFAPHAVKARELLAGRSEPLAVNITINAGHIPVDVWHHDPAVGGGRIIGEGCHWIDLAMFLVGVPITSVYAAMFGPQAGRLRDDKMSISMTFADGSIATLHYWANGPKSYPKELVEVFSEGRVLKILNWRRLETHNFAGAPAMRSRMQKGFSQEVAAWLDAVAAGGPSPIPFEQLDMVTNVSFAAVRSAQDGVAIRIANAPSESQLPSPQPTAE